ncbi:MAG: SEL1-like repeat protein [Gammaproteobacteria bacterium]|nr:SEL1-like repeat protein [Gammaproteobacteria bacterium]
MKKTTFTLFLILFTQVALADFSSALESYQHGNLPKAAAEFKTLANYNDADAQYMLGYMYALGEGVTQDYIKAHKWLNIAASQGKEGARKARDRVADRMSRNQITKAQQLARNWKPIPTQIPSSFASNQPQTTRSTSSRNTIMNVQRRLSELGYQPGPADGSSGGRTRDAIRRYQMDNQLTVNGQVTQELVKHLQAGTTPHSPALHYPQVWTTPKTKPNKATMELVGELKSLIEKIKTNKAADRWVIKDLRKLVKKNQRPWPHLLMHEKFSKRKYRLSNKWEVVSGKFHVRPGAGLLSNAKATYSSRNDNRKELAAAILKSFIKGDNRHFKKHKTAQITSKQIISNAFATKARFNSIERKSRIAIMLSRGKKKDSGYRLILDTDGKRDKISLVHVSRSGRTIIESFRGQLGLSDGAPHTAEWTRNKAGKMAVAIDGKELFRTHDTNISKGFSQISITNIGGDYMLRDLMLFDAKI